VAAQCIGAVLATWLIGWLVRPAAAPAPARAATPEAAD